MNPALKDILHNQAFDYVLVSKDLRILDFSLAAARFAHDPSSISRDVDVRVPFPEIVGIEETLAGIINGEEKAWKIRGIDRSRNGIPLFLSVQVESNRHSEGCILLLEDMTEQMLLEQKLVQRSSESVLLLNALQASKAYLESIIDSMGEILFVTSPSGIIQLVNRAAINLLGYVRVDLIGQPIQRFVPDPEIIAGIPPDSSEPHPVRMMQAMCMDRDGREIPVLFTRSSVRSDIEGHQGIIFLGRDLTERMNSEAAIHKLQEEKGYLLEEIKAQLNFEEIIGSSEAMVGVFKQIDKVAATDSTVLLHGETGTGKELVARAIHSRSMRSEKVIVRVNCAALPSGLVESELFGHEKGSFTGATARRIGRFELADGGTLLLDEVGELPLDTQSKLLRVLQEHEFERVGGSTTLKVDVRVIAATNKNLKGEVQRGTFREDLYYRLNVFPIHIPPLRERKDDIPPLTTYFVNKFTQRMKKPIDAVSSGFIQKLMNYSWPGNVRELASVLERAVILCDSKVLSHADIGQIERAAPSVRRRTNLKDLQRDHIMQVLQEAGGVIEGPNGAAARLGINPSTLRSRLRKLGIKRKHGTFVRSSSP